MTPILTDLLDLVTGGGNSTSRIGVPGASYSSSTTDYKRCVDTVVAQTAAQYPSTKPWYNPFATDTNAGPRGAATIANMRSTCGLPPG
jgi:hypothetical protein